MYNLNKDWFVSMSLQAYNAEKSPYWHISDPIIINQTGYSNAELFYQPCGAMQCPTGTYC